MMTDSFLAGLMQAEKTVSIKALYNTSTPDKENVNITEDAPVSNGKFDDVLPNAMHELYSSYLEFPEPAGSQGNRGGKILYQRKGDARPEEMDMEHFVSAATAR